LTAKPIVYLFIFVGDQLPLKTKGDVSLRAEGRKAQTEA
jgi:hypothetical protein